MNGQLTLRAGILLLALTSFGSAQQHSAKYYQRLGEANGAEWVERYEQDKPKLDAADRELNRTYTQVMTLLNRYRRAQDIAELRKDERNWIRYRDQAAEEAASGSRESDMGQWSRVYNRLVLTRKRVSELKDMLTTIQKWAAARQHWIDTHPGQSLPSGTH